MVLQAFAIVSRIQCGDVMRSELIGALKVISFLIGPDFSPKSNQLPELLQSLVFAVRWSAHQHGTEIGIPTSASTGADGLRWSLKVRLSIEEASH
jgi:hypothetical protein